MKVIQIVPQLNEFTKNFKFIIESKKIPILQEPSIMKYVMNEERTILFCKIFYKENIIAKGIILDFYKEFDIRRNQYGKSYTQIITNTQLGNMVYKIKYYKNPPLPITEKNRYLNTIVDIFEEDILKGINPSNKVMSFIPSKSKIPDEIAQKLAQKTGIPIQDFIKKKSNIESKNQSDIFDKDLNLYSIDFDKIDKSDKCIIIDDVVGTGASLCEVMYKLHKFNNQINIFLAIVKDVKR